MADEYIDKVEVGAKIQMMYIRREMDYGGENDFCRGMRKALRVIENMPAADVQPIRHGRWFHINNDGIIYCSECENEAYWDTDYGQQLFDYCPYCGAKMIKDGEQK